MLVDLIKVFIRKIENNTWLSPSTKKQALLKLNNLNLVVGSPKILREDPLLDYKNNDPWENLQKIAKWRFNKYIQLDGKEINW
jgi:predicted metalloendopeptidase